MFHNVLLKINLEHIYSEIFFSLRGKFCFPSFLMRNLKLRKSLSVDCYEGDYFFISQYFRSICQAIITQIIHYEWTCFTEKHYVCKGQSNSGTDFISFFRFGWYIPEVFATKSPPIKDHWRAFTNPKVTSMFTSSKDEEFIKKHTKREDGR